MREAGQAVPWRRTNSRIWRPAPSGTRRGPTGTRRPDCSAGLTRRPASRSDRRLGPPPSGPRRPTRSARPAWTQASVTLRTTEITFTPADPIGTSSATNSSARTSTKAGGRVRETAILGRSARGCGHLEQEFTGCARQPGGQTVVLGSCGTVRCRQLRKPSQAHPGRWLPRSCVRASRSTTRLAPRPRRRGAYSALSADAIARAGTGAGTRSSQISRQ